MLQYFFVQGIFFHKQRKITGGEGRIKDMSYSNESDNLLANTIHSDDFFLQLPSVFPLCNLCSVLKTK